MVFLVIENIKLYVFFFRLNINDLLKNSCSIFKGVNGGIYEYSFVRYFGF